ncbi:MAG: nitroreductase family protein [Blastocatellia bacterium]|nr:nitroreductase family protein [Blastocatellia bacterium]
MEKFAETSYPVADVVRKRWSTVIFSEKLIEREKLLSLIEAARWASSCFNEQPWSFIVATKDDLEEYAKMLDCIVEGNREWASTAPVLMISVAKLHFDRNGSPNRHSYHDVGLAIGNMVTQATEMGIHMHQMGGFYLDKTREVYSIPETHDPVAAIALGYLGEIDSASEALQNREKSPRSRKTIDKFLFSGKWGEVSKLI